MDKKILANEMNVPLSTIYSWEKTKPKLMELVKLGIKAKKGISENTNEINIYFNQLNENEKEMYLSEIKAIVLRRKLNLK